MAYTNELLSNHKESWRKHGSSIMADGWTSRTNQSLINILVNYSTGTIFVKSINASCILKTKEKKNVSITWSFVDQIGEANVVQVEMDNGSNYVLVGK